MNASSVSDTESMSVPMIVFTHDFDNPDACGPTHAIAGDGPSARWGNAIIRGAARQTDPNAWVFDAKPGEKFVVNFDGQLTEGTRADVGDEHSLVLIHSPGDGELQHVLPWEGIIDVAVIGSPGYA